MILRDPKGINFLLLGRRENKSLVESLISLFNHTLIRSTSYTGGGKKEGALASRRRRRRRRRRGRSSSQLGLNRRSLPSHGGEAHMCMKSPFSESTNMSTQTRGQRSRRGGAAHGPHAPVMSR